MEESLVTPAPTSRGRENKRRSRSCVSCERREIQLRIVANRLRIRGFGWHAVSSEEVVVIHLAVHASGDLGSFRAEGRTSALQEDHDYNAADSGVGIRSEPAVASAGMRTGSRFAEDFFLVEVEAQAARCAILHRARHAVGKFGNDWSDIELALYTRLEARNFIRSRRMLQIVERAAVGDRRNHRAELQWGHGDAFTERAHL